MSNIEETFGLRDMERDKINAVMLRHKTIQQAIVYGSRAKGNFANGSDIDITLLGELTWDEMNQIETELDELMLPYQFDISLFKILIIWH